MAPGSSPKPRRRTKRVSAQQNRERVRNNQRRHRARRKDHIATLEQKLGEAEQTILTLREQTTALQAALARCGREIHDRNRADCHAVQSQRRQSHNATSSPLLTPRASEAFQNCGVVSDTEDLGGWEMPVLTSTDLGLSGEQIGFDVNAVISAPDDDSPSLIHLTQQSEFISELPLITECFTNQTNAKAESLLPTARMDDPKLSPATPCCYYDISSDLRLSIDAANPMSLVPSQENSQLMLEHMLQSMDDYPQTRPCNESTILCSEAYILIAEQNVKGVTNEVVATWLWNGFRRSLQPGEGCRVQTDMLFSLLAFISDT